MNQREIISKQLKRARLEKGLSQKDLADQVGISRMMISRYEVGSSSISLKQIQKIAETLEKPISYFFGEEPQNNSKEVWIEARKYLEVLKKKFDGNINFSPKEMLAFSLGDPSKQEEAMEEVKTLMKNWYLAHNMQKSTNKTFEEWWENKKITL